MRFGISAKVMVTSMLTAAAFVVGGATLAAGASNIVTLQNVYDDWSYAESQADVTMAAMEELQTAPVEEIPQACNAFRRSVILMEGAGARLLAHANGIYSYGRSYFLLSDKSGIACEYPRLKSGEGLRPAELGEFFDPVAVAAREARHAYLAYLFDITQLNEYPCTISPNARGVDSVTFLFRKAEVDSAALMDALERAIGVLELAKSANAETQQAPPPPQPPQPQPPKGG